AVRSRYGRWCSAPCRSSTAPAGFSTRQRRRRSSADAVGEHGEPPAADAREEERRLAIAAQRELLAELRRIDVDAALLDLEPSDAALAQGGVDGRNLGGHRLVDPERRHEG